MIRRVVVFLLIALASLLVLGAQYLRRAPIGSNLLRERIGALVSDFDSPDLQWMVAMCLGLYFVGFTIWQRLLRRQILAGQNPIHKRSLTLGFGLADICLFAFAGVAIFAYASQFPESASRPEFLVLITGLTLGQGVSALRLWRRKRGCADNFPQLILAAFMFVLTLAAVFHPDMGKVFQYRDQSRWIGPWDNPNTYGLLMGLGVTLAAGQFFKQTSFKVKRSDGNEAQSGFKPHWVSILLYLVATLVMGFGLIKSYSRGAWLATFCGLSYLAYAFMLGSVLDQGLVNSSARVPDAKLRQLKSPWSRFLPSVAIITLSLSIIAFWNLRHTEHRLVRRIVSVGNMNDFSWRNRVVASEGALQMMSDRPWFGFGWNQPEPVYNEHYRPDKLVEGMAIVLNDYLVLGMTLGLPALACFLIYVYSRFYSGHRSFVRDRTQLTTTDLGMAVCRAGFIVLLIGFLPDRGLFYLAMGAPFWILLELGKPDCSASCDQMTEPRKSAEKRATLQSTPELCGLGVLSRSSRYCVPLVLLVGFIAAMMWAKSRDPFKRVEFSLKTASGEKVNGIAVLPKPVGKHPVVIYVYGSGGSLLTSGKDLRQIADLGLAAVGTEYNQTNQAVFDEQFVALHQYLKQQSWAQSNAVAWVGFSLGAQRALSFALTHPGLQPRLMVRMAGGWVEELNEKFKIQNSKSEVKDSETTGDTKHSTLNTQHSTIIHCPVLLVHGEKDETFPVDDATRLATLLRAHGVSIAVEILPGRNHEFEPDRAVVFRVVGEYCRSVLVLTEPFDGLPEKSAMSLWIYLIPTFIVLTFWLLLKWRVCSTKSKSFNSVRAKLETGLRRLAWGMALLALGVTAFHLMTPNLSFSETTSRIGRRFLIRPEWREDFDFLSTNSIWANKPLKILLEHVTLANYNRSLVNWRLDERIYREFVLSPIIEPESNPELNWRRPLWESFYPRIRKEQTPESAAQIVVRHLRERVTIVSDTDRPAGVETIWMRQIASEKDFEIIYVAALRSVGVPARLDKQAQAEFYTGSAWQSAPRPVIEKWALLPLGTQTPN